MRPRLSILLMLLVLALAPNVLADSYTFTTSGCFSGGTCSSNGSSSVSFLNLLGNTTLSFSNISTPTTVSSGTTFSLGSFDLSAQNPSLSFYLGSFKLGVNFTSPAGTSGNPFFAWVTGDVVWNSGGATITLSPNAQVFTYPGGTFALDLISDPVYLGPNSTAVLSARIVSVPEGSALAMLGISSLVLLGAFFKKRSSWATSNAC